MNVTSGIIKYLNSFRTSHDDLDKLLTFETRADAEKTYDLIKEFIDKYGSFTLADLKDSRGVTSYYTDNKYGWKTLENICVIHRHDGYYLDLPMYEDI